MKQQSKMPENLTQGRWETNIQRWSSLNDDAAKLYIAQAEGRLKETIDTYNTTSSRTDKFFGISTTLLSVSIGYIFNGSNRYLQATSVFVALFSAISLYFLWKNTKPVTIYPLGEEPKFIFTSTFVDVHEGNEQYLNLVFQIMETIQFKIEENRNTNFKRTQNNTYARLFLLLTPTSFFWAAIYQYLGGYYLVWAVSMGTF